MSIVITEPGRDDNDYRPRSPRLSRGHVHRERLYERFDSAAPVVLVVAPAGTGKTTALAGWIATCTDPTRWIDFARDARPDALWQEIAHGFGVSLPSAGEGVPAHFAPIGDVVIGLTEALEQTLDREHVLVIDGFDSDDADSVAAVGLFLQRLPSNLRVVIAARRHLPLPLDGLRMRGDLSEMGYDELRFTSNESAAVLAQLAPGVDSPPEVTAALAWTRPPGASVRAVQLGGSGRTGRCARGYRQDHSARRLDCDVYGSHTLDRRRTGRAAGCAVAGDRPRVRCTSALRRRGVPADSRQSATWSSV